MTDHTRSAYSICFSHIQRSILISGLAGVEQYLMSLCTSIEAVPRTFRLRLLGTRRSPHSYWYRSQCSQAQLMKSEACIVSVLIPDLRVSSSVPKEQAGQQFTSAETMTLFKCEQRENQMSSTSYYSSSAGLTFPASLTSAMNESASPRTSQ